MNQLQWSRGLSSGHLGKRFGGLAMNTGRTQSLPRGRRQAERTQNIWVRMAKTGVVVRGNGGKNSRNRRKLENWKKTVQRGVLSRADDLLGIRINNFRITNGEHSTVKVTKKHRDQIGFGLRNIQNIGQCVTVAIKIENNRTITFNIKVVSSNTSNDTRTTREFTKVSLVVGQVNT
ncbi:unnamed protein product [[Candida] boidinii]|uniref:Unnamed protein product n=1 Tax=Candida boidinii TaxID=5477 RepID=A0A9W6TAU8_CANBO|nr:unnamed protein product [[Candida] boidinii]GMF60945.1 unnamed protein product [[Candida] boidinii]